METPEVRELVYFTAVAEELHFGRAAARLGMTQPPLSRAIQQLERRLGVLLMERGPRGVTLTEAGAVLLRESRTVLDATAATVRRVTRAGRDDPRLVLVVKPGGDGGLLPAILDAYQDEPSALPVELVWSFGEREILVRQGSADAALLHRPHHDLGGLDAQDLLTESQLLVVPRSHRLAGRDSVLLSDLAEEPLPRWPGVAGDRPHEPEIHDLGQLLHLIALGRMVAVLPSSIRNQLRDDLAAVPVEDAEPTTLILAWPSHATSPALTAFIRATTAVAARSTRRSELERA
ncbi:LysR family transcriptional regulator [Microbacterium sp. ARD32]|uniref:LysR family transcriptional regulator n=1 Tax=Microbacterium sp. ARD32 TaxID=2962577 RepID=UPI0028816075|nr:LysR family transcriptional regulator [Microbacterium sp. ARD32]MDT0157253.1 LysR family transcriptional regulator [Microbacterium sp. ARD32]